MTIHRSSQPDPRKPWHVLRRTDLDATALLRHQPHAPVEREIRGSLEHAHINRLIAKPWGQELRVYDDDHKDVWCLEIDGEASTSMHAHVRKRTYLVGLAGQGVLRTIDDREYAIEPGVIIQIEPGVLHATRAEGPLSLLEVEIPPDKLDLVRLADRYDRPATAYENAASARPGAAPLSPAPGGPPNARLRRSSGSGRFGFALETDATIRRRSEGLVVAISLDAGADGQAAPAIAGGPAALSELRPGQAHLTVRELRATSPPLRFVG